MAAFDFSDDGMYRHSFYPLFFLTILMVAVGQMTQTLYVPSIPMMAGTSMWPPANCRR